MQNVLAKHEMFEEIGGGETSKQGQEVKSVSCQANNVRQFRQAFIHTSCHLYLLMGNAIQTINNGKFSNVNNEFNVRNVRN